MLKAHQPKHTRKPRYLHILFCLLLAAYFGAKRPTPLPVPSRVYAYACLARGVIHHVLFLCQSFGTGICPEQCQTPQQQLTTRFAEHGLALLGSGVVLTMVPFDCHPTQR